MSEFPSRVDRTDPIGRQARKLMDESARAVIQNDVYLADFARHILAARRERDRFFDPLLFANPVWDLLLNLYVADGEEGTLPIADCISLAGLPASVASRWFAFLKQEDMVAEAADTSASGQACLRLSGHARLAITAYLSSLAAMGLGHGLVPGRGDAQDTPKRAVW